MQARAQRSREAGKGPWTVDRPAQQPVTLQGAMEAAAAFGSAT